MSSIQNSSYNYQNNSVLEQSANLRKSVTPEVENINTTKIVDKAEKANSSTKESVKVELSVNINKDSKNVEFMDNLKEALRQIGSNQNLSKSNDKQLEVLNDVKNSLQQSQVSGLFGTSSLTSSFDDIANKLKTMDENDPSKVEELGLDDLLKRPDPHLNSDNINNFIQNLTSAIETVTQEKTITESKISDQNSNVLEQSKKLRESMGYGDEQMAKVKQIDMGKESENFSKQNVVSQAGSLVQSQSSNANLVNRNIF